MKKLILTGFFALSLPTWAAIQEESSYELTCRAKAKELAAQTYRSCVTENKSAEIDRLRKEYKERLRTLKEDYEKEIERMGGKTSKAAVRAKGQIAKKPGKKSDEMVVELRHVSPAISDDSQMDLPEPIPVEALPSVTN